MESDTVKFVIDHSFFWFFINWTELYS